MDSRRHAAIDVGAIAQHLDPAKLRRIADLHASLANAGAEPRIDLRSMKGNAAQAFAARPVRKGRIAALIADSAPAVV